MVKIHRIVYSGVLNVTLIIIQTVSKSGQILVFFFHHLPISLNETKCFKKYLQKVNTNNNVHISYNVLRNSRSGKSTYKIHF